MITGKLTLYPEEHKPTYAATDSVAEYWDNWFDDRSHVRTKYHTPPNFEELLDETIADALARGFHIGAKVQRRVSTSKSIGEILHFDKSKDAWRPWNQRVEVLRVKFPDTFNICNYHPEELNLVTGA